MGFDEEQKLISIVVPVVNDDPRLNDCLSYLKRHTSMPHEILIQLAPSIPAAIADGCARAAGNYLCWLDPSIRVTAGWLEGLIRIYRVFASCGITVPRRLKSQEVITLGEPYRRYPDILVNQSLDLSCALIPLWIYRTVGPFDHRYELRHVADGDYFERLRQNNFFVGVSGGSVVDWEPFAWLSDEQLLAYDHDTDLAIHRDRRRGLAKATRIATAMSSGVEFNDAQRGDFTIIEA